MNKKKLLTLAMVLSMVAILAIGGTMAYFTDNDKDYNVMVLGNVEIQQNEGMRDENGTIVPFEEQKMNPSTIDPNWDGEPINVNGVEYQSQDVGNWVDKIVTVTNIGSETAYIRTLLAFQQTDPDGNGDFSDGISELIHINYNTTDGVLDLSNVLEGVMIDGAPYQVLTYTYTDSYAEDETTPPSLLQVWLDKETTNEDVKPLLGGGYRIVVLSQAVQADGFEEYNVSAAEALNTAFGEVTKEKAEEWFNSGNMKTTGPDNWEGNEA